MALRPTRTANRPLITLATIATTLCTGAAWVFATTESTAPASIAGVLQPRAATPTSSIAQDPQDRRQSRPAARLEGVYVAPIGQQLSYALEFTVGSELARRTDGARAQNSQAHLAGQLQLTVLDRREQEAVVAVRLPGLHGARGIAASDAAKPVVDELCAALAQPTLMRIDTEGQVTGYRFPQRFTYLHKAHVRAVLAGLRFIVPHEAEQQPTWTALDQDDTGEFEAAYRWLEVADADRTLVREREHYTAPNVRTRGQGDLTITVQGRSTARLSEAAGWLADADFDDRTTVSFDALDVDIAARCTGSVRLEECTKLPLSTLARVDWDAAWEPVGGDQDAAFALAQEREMLSWQRELEGVELRDLIGRMAALAASGAEDTEDYRDAWEKLARLLELRPELADEVAAWLRPGALDESSAVALLTALGAAGTDRAQAALLRIQHDGDVPPALRGAATMALTQVQEPTPATMERMLASATAADGDDLGRLGLMVLGTVAPRATAPLADGRSALDALVALEEQYEGSDNLDAWLHALGNSGSAEAAAHAQAYLDHADERLREAAVIAMRSARGASAEQRLIATARGDASHNVRGRAAETLAELGTDRARSALAEIVLQDPDVRVREAAIQAIGRVLDDHARNALQHASINDAEEELRRLATELLLRAD